MDNIQIKMLNNKDLYQYEYKFWISSDFTKGKTFKTEISLLKIKLTKWLKGICKYPIFVDFEHRETYATKFFFKIRVSSSMDFMVNISALEKLLNNNNIDIINEKEIIVPAAN